MQHMITQPETDWANRNRTTSSPNDAMSVGTPGSYASNNSLDARLLAIGGVYTQRYVDSMTQNDKVYAVRVNDDPTTI